MSDTNLYIIKDGEVGFFIESTCRDNKPTHIRTLKKGDYFGEYSFFTGKNHLTTAKSLSFSSLFVIKKETFLEILRNFPEDYEKYCQIKDQINLYKDFSQLFLLCEACHNPNHNIIKCPWLHLSLCKSRILDKYNFSTPQTRMFYQRLKGKKSFQTLLQRNLVDLSARNLTYDLFEGSLYIENESLKEESNNQKDREAMLSHNNVSSQSSFPFVSQDNFVKKKSSGSIKEQTKNSLEKKNKFQHGEDDIISNTINNTINEISEGKNERLIHLIRFSFDLDSVKSYEMYFPSQNVEHFIEKLKIAILKKQKKVKNEIIVSSFFVNARRNGRFNSTKPRRDFNIEMEKFFKEVKHKKKETEYEKLIKMFKKKRNFFSEKAARQKIKTGFVNACCKIKNMISSVCKKIGFV